MWNGKHNRQNSNNGYKTSKKTFRHSTHTVTDISLFSIRFFDDLSSTMILIVLCSRYGYILASKPSTKSVLEKKSNRKMRDLCNCMRTTMSEDFFGCFISIITIFFNTESSEG